MAASLGLIIFASRDPSPPPYPITIDAQRAVVRIETFGDTGLPIGEGCGVAFENNRVMTALHVLEGVQRASVQLADGSRREVIGVVGWSERADLAVLHLDGAINYILPFSDFLPAPGDRLTIVPSRYLFQPPPPSLVTWTGVSPEYGLMIHVKQGLSLGMSGSPLVDIESGVFRGIAVASDFHSIGVISADLDSALPDDPVREPIPLDEFAGASSPRTVARSLVYRATQLLETNPDTALELIEEALRTEPDSYAVQTTAAEILIHHEQLDRAEELLRRTRIQQFGLRELYLETLIWAKRDRPEMFEDLDLHARLIAASPDRQRSWISMLILAGRERMAHDLVENSIKTLESMGEPVPEWMDDIRSTDPERVLGSILRFAKEQAASP